MEDLMQPMWYVELLHEKKSAHSSHSKLWSKFMLVRSGHRHTRMHSSCLNLLTVL